MQGLARRAVHFHQDAAQPDVADRHVERVRQMRDQMPDHPVFPPAEHRIIRPRHPHVTDVRGAARQDAFIRRWDVRMRAEDDAELPVEMPAQRHLLTRRLRVHVQHDDLHIRRDLCQRLFDPAEGAVGRRLHVQPAHRRDHRDLRPQPRFVNGKHASRRVGREIRRPHDALRPLQHRDDLLLAVDVIAQREQVHAVPPKLVVERRRKPRPPGRILGVTDDAVEIVLFDQVGQRLRQHKPPRPPDHVPHAQNVDLHTADFLAADVALWHRRLACAPTPGTAVPHRVIHSADHSG